MFVGPPSTADSLQMHIVWRPQYIMSTNLPLRLSRSLPTRCVRSPLTARQFSTTAPAWGRARVGAEGRRKGPVDPVMAEATARSQKYKAPSALQAEQMNSDKAIPDDLGLLPGMRAVGFLYVGIECGANSLKERSFTNRSVDFHRFR